MNPTDSDYAAFLDRLPELRRLYDPRLHQFEVTKGPGTGDSLERVERYFARVGSVRGPNRQTLRRLVAFGPLQKWQQQCRHSTLMKRRGSVGS